MLDVPVLDAIHTLAPPFLITEADNRTDYLALRHETFVLSQGLFAGSDRDDTDDDPRTVVLEARSPAGDFLGGVRLAPATATDLGWWTGSRLVARGVPGVGAALVAAACARAEAAGVLRFEATVQSGDWFERLGWQRVGATTVQGRPHAVVRWPIGRIAALVEATKAPLGVLLDDMHCGGSGFRGDDGAPVPGSDLVAACDAIVPSMVERDPEWAGWCGVLVNVGDLAAMGATPVGLLDAVAGRDTAAVTRVLAGVRAAAQAWDVPVLGGHTQLGVPAALSITALGRTDSPVPAGGGRVGDRVHLTADLSGSWRPGYGGRQWDSSSHRDSAVLRAQQASVAAARPSAAKDVSMAGAVGTLGMLAEASGTGATLDVAGVPRPDAANVGDWLTCFPGFAMLTTAPLSAPGTVGAACATLDASPGVRLRWPDGIETTALTGAASGLGAA